MNANLRLHERISRLVLGGIFVFAALVLFTNAVTRTIVGLAGFFVISEAAASRCVLFSRLGVKTTDDAPKPETRNLLGLLAIQLIVAYEWGSAGWEKIVGGEFVEGIGKTLAYFASKNPYPWFQTFLLGFATAHASTFAHAVEIGEFAAGLALAVASVWHVLATSDAHRRWSLRLMFPALLAGMAMNATFYLAAGWTGAGTAGINVVMFWTQAALLYVWTSTCRSMAR